VAAALPSAVRGGDLRRSRRRDLRLGAVGYGRNGGTERGGERNEREREGGAGLGGAGPPTAGRIGPG
jgi:hypothetical protein